MKIMLDAGHYAKANRSPVLKTYYESEMTWKLTNYLKAELEAYGIIVGLTRSVQSVDLAVEERGRKAKGYDLFISIHSNACDTESVDRPTMIVNLNGKTTMLGRTIGATVQNVMRTNQPYKIATREWGGRPGVEYYGVLRGAQEVGVPGIIVEHSFHTNLRAAQWLSVDANLKEMARQEAQTIAAFYGIQKPKSKEEPKKPATVTSPVPPANTTIKVGDKVKIKNTAKYTNGKNIPGWVKKSKMYVRQIESNGTVLLVSIFPVLKLYTGRVKTSDVQKI